MFLYVRSGRVLQQWVFILSVSFLPVHHFLLRICWAGGQKSTKPNQLCSRVAIRRYDVICLIRSSRYRSVCVCECECMYRTCVFCTVCCMVFCWKQPVSFIWGYKTVQENIFTDENKKLSQKSLHFPPPAAAVIFQIHLAYPIISLQFGGIAQMHVTLKKRFSKIGHKTKA